MNIRLAVLFEYPTLNGGERSMLQTLALAPRNEFEFVALAPPTGRLADELQRQGIRIAPLTLRDSQGRRLPKDECCVRIANAAQDERLDLLHANSLSMGRLTGAVSNRLPIPCLSHLRDILRLSQAAVDDLNRNRTLVAVSAATRDFHVGQGLDATRTRVVYNGVDCDRFAPRERHGQLARSLGIERSARLLLTIGQIGPRKGQDVLAAAALAIVRQVPHAHFVVVGERNSSKRESIEFEQNLSRVFASHGLRDHFHLLGYRHDVPELLNEADMLIHPARQEPLGRVLLEAAASGCPIVATDVGGTSEILADAISARLIAPDSVDELADAVVELARDRAQGGRLAENARRTIERQFRGQDACDALCSVWRRCVGGESPAC